MGVFAGMREMRKQRRSALEKMESRPEDFNVRPSAENRLKQVLFGPWFRCRTVKGIIERQIDVMDVHDHPGLQSWQDTEEEEYAVVPDAHLVTGIDEKEVTRLQCVENRHRVHLLHGMAMNLVGDRCHFRPGARID